MDEFLIQLQAKLDEAKSKGNINSDIDKIQSQIDKLKIQAEIDPKTISNLVKQLETVLNQKINISNININQSQVSKQATQTGQQIGNSIAQGITSGINKATSSLKSFSELKLGTGNISAILNEDGLVDAEQTLNKIKQIYSEFGQVRITNQIFDSGELQEFKVNIQQVNGDLKETRSFIMALSADRKSFAFPNDIIKGSESIVHHLNEAKNATTQIATETDKLAEKIQNIQSKLDNGYGVSQYQNQIDGLVNDFQKYGVSVEQAETTTQNLQNILNNMQTASGQSLVNLADDFDKEFKAVKVSVDAAKQSFDKFLQPVSDEKITSLIIKIQDFLNKNTAITKEARTQLSNYVNELNGGNISLSRWNEINLKLKETDSSMRGLGKLGKSVTDQFVEAGKSFSSWLSVSSAIMLLVSQTKNAIGELKELDNILTEINKTSDLTKSELKELGNSAFESASKYGQTASDYLTGVQEMYRAGYDNAEQMSELAILAKSAGDMTSDMANDYLIATDAAYNLQGNIEKLNEVLDGQNFITNNSAVSMQDMAEATSEAASIASQYGVEINELSSLIAVATSKTRESGSEVGNALKSIFVNLQDTTSKPITDVFDSIGVSMTKIVDGSERLKTPIELLKELSDVFVSLDEGSTLRANILSDIGGKYHANTLSAILSDWESFEEMMTLYSNGMGSAAEEAEKSANNWSGSWNKVKNSFTDFIQNFVDSDVMIGAINGLNGLITTIDKFSESIGTLGTIGLGAGLVGGIKNIGKYRISVRISKSFI